MQHIPCTFLASQKKLVRACSYTVNIRCTFPLWLLYQTFNSLSLHLHFQQKFLQLKLRVSSPYLRNRQISRRRKKNTLTRIHINTHMYTYERKPSYAENCRYLLAHISATQFQVSLSKVHFSVKQMSSCLFFIGPS